MSLQIYVPISKIDAEKRMVWGYASTPTLDLQGERISLDAIKEALPDYMQWANVREMHQLSAVGVAKEAAVDDKGLYVGAKVVDDEAWKKCLESVYKGYSIGGERLEKQDDTITKLKLLEISLVDRPANPDCRIEVEKAARPAVKSAAPSGELIALEREEIGLFGRLLQKLAKATGAARDGFSLPATPGDPLADERRLNMRPLQSGGDRGGDTTLKPSGPGDRAGSEEVEECELPKELDELKAAGEDVKDEFDHLVSHYESERVKHAHPADDLSTKEKARRALAVRHHGYEFADTKNYKYGLNNEKEIRASWNYIHQEKNRKLYSADEVKRIEARIVRAWRDKIDPNGPPSADEKAVVGSLAKACDVIWAPSSTMHQMASVYDQLISLSRSLRFEADAEVGDRKDYGEADAISRLAQALGGLLAEKAGHEVQEEKQREAARKSLVAAGINQESITMSKSILEAGNAGGGDPAEIAKRVATTHKVALQKALHHAEEAEKCSNEAQKCFGKAAEHFDAAHRHSQEAHKCFGKADNTEQLREHVEKVVHHLGGAHKALAEMDGHHADAAEHREISRHHLEKVTSSWVGEHAESPGAADPGVYQPEGGLSALSQSRLTGGDVPQYRSDAPYKAAGVDVAVLVKGFQDSLKEALDEVAKSKAETEYQRGRAETLAAMPAGRPRAAVFAVDKGALGGATGSDDAAKILLDGVDVDALRAAEGGDLEDASEKAAGTMIGNMIRSTMGGKHRFGKSVFDPTFRGLKRA